MAKRLWREKIGAVVCSVALVAGMNPMLALAGERDAASAAPAPAPAASAAKQTAPITPQDAASSLAVSQAEAFEAQGQYLVTAKSGGTMYAMDSDLTADEVTVDNDTATAADSEKDLNELLWVYEAGDEYGYLKNASTGEYLYYDTYDYKMSTSAEEKDTVSYEDQRVILSYLMWDYSYNDKLELSYGSEFVAESYTDGSVITLYKVGEGGGQETCEHEWVDEVVAPTCTEQGYTVHRCSKCNEEKIDTYTEALDHDFTGVAWVTTLEPTCAVNGEQQRQCTRCDHVETQALASLGHDFTKLTDNGDTHRASCSRCDAEPEDSTVAAADEMVDGKKYVLVYGTRALTSTPYTSGSYVGDNMTSITFDAAAVISSSAVWTWSNGHLMNGGKYLANPSGTGLAMTAIESEALTFEYKADFYGDGMILDATNPSGYYSALGVSSTVSGLMGLVSAYSNEALVAIYEATPVPSEVAHTYVDGVCACGHQEFVCTIKGDVNNSGKMNIVDAQVAYDLATDKCSEQAIGALLSLWGEGVTISNVKTVANFNGDDMLDATDAFAIQAAIHGAQA